MFLILYHSKVYRYKIHVITVPSQVVVARTLTKKNAMMSVTTKVAMQLNCKLGGELWALEIPVSCLLHMSLHACSRNVHNSELDRDVLIIFYLLFECGILFISQDIMLVQTSPEVLWLLWDTIVVIGIHYVM